MLRQIVPHVVDKQDVVTITPDQTIQDAAKMMAERHIGAVLVTDNGKLVGIFTERDVLMRVVAKDMDPKSTKVGEVMTKNPDTLGPNDRAADAFQMMVQRGYRHLPILDGDAIVAIVSVRDIYQSINQSLAEEIEQREQLMFGTSGGLS